MPKGGVKAMSRDLSEYEEYWTIPKRVLAKRLTESLTINIVKDGVEGELYGEPGHVHVVDNSGDVTKETILTEEKFKKKYDKLEVQNPLFIKKVEHVDPETGEVTEQKYG